MDLGAVVCFQFFFLHGGLSKFRGFVGIGASGDATRLITIKDSGGSSVSSGQKSFTGYISDVRVYNSALSEQNIQSLFLNPGGLRGGGTTIQGDQISTGKLKSNNWNDSTIGSLNDFWNFSYNVIQGYFR